MGDRDKEENYRLVIIVMVFASVFIICILIGMITSSQELMGMFQTGFESVEIQGIDMSNSEEIPVN